jgi:hypothetical protein
MGTLLLFIDGVGIGRDAPEENPFAAAGVRRLGPVSGRPSADGAAFRPLDTTLGVEGLPQSATNQTALFTGVNAPRVVGRHVQGLPGPTLREILNRESLFLKLVRAGRKPTFANAYTRKHLEARRPRWSATTRMVLASGIPFRMLEDEGMRGEALYHDYTGDWHFRLGFDVPRYDAEGAARVLVGLAETHDLVLYEYFLTDLAGHRGSWGEKILQARRVEDLVDRVLARIDLDRHRLVVVSDHGNLEEGRHKLHTLNPVPLLAWGAGAGRFVDQTGSLLSLSASLCEGPV